MSKDLRETLIKALQNPEQYEAFFAEQSMKEALYTQNTATVTFCDNDLLLGTVDHNRPLYVTAESNNMEIHRILIDPGSSSSVNLMSLKTLKGLALDIQYLTKSTVFLQGFNEQGQRTLPWDPWFYL